MYSTAVFIVSSYKSLNQLEPEGYNVVEVPEAHIHPASWHSRLFLVFSKTILHKEPKQAMDRAAICCHEPSTVPTDAYNLGLILI